ncbi:hypothetical protein ACQP1O_22975 [Nocardia sp. CA-151230]|uniref:hypothetical protein n=1 Tax=Nocardia sp. CA-151230 TaxID=3239982 RepID=UPI003D950291
MMIFVYIVLGLLVLVLVPLAVFFALLTVYTIFNAIVHRDSRPRRRSSGSIDTLGISSDTSHSDIAPHHGGHHHGGHHHDSGGHHGGHSDSGGHHTTSWTD